MEDRTLLAAVIPDVLTPSQLTSAEQALFPQGRTSRFFEPQGLSGEGFYRFATDANGQASEIAFTVENTNTFDGAVGIFDGSGNRIVGENQVGFLPFLAVVPETQTFLAQPDTNYILGVFYDATSQPEQVWFSAETSQTALNSALKVEPTSGPAQFAPPIGNDSFSSADDVDFFPIEFLNARDQASLIITKSTPGAQVFSELYVANSIGDWELIQPTQVDSLVTFYEFTSSDGKSLDEHQYQLAVAPLDFDAAAVPVSIDIFAAPAGRGTVPPTVVPEFIDIPFSDGGTRYFEQDRLLSDDLGLEADYFAFEATSNGAIRLEAITADFAPVVSVYDSTSREVAMVRYSNHGVVSFEFETRRGETYLVRVGEVSDSDGGTDNYLITLSETYDFDSETVVSGSPVALSADESTPLQVHSQIAHLTAGTDIDVVVLELDKATNVQILGTSVGPTFFAGSPGEPMRIVLDVRSEPGTFDVVVGRASDGSVVNAAVAGISVPDNLTNNDVSSLRRDVNVATGDYSVGRDMVPFGSFTGVTWQNIRNDDGDAAELAVRGSEPTLLGLYERTENNGLALREVVFPSEPLITEFSSTLANDEQFALIAMPLSFVTTGLPQFNFEINGAVPDGVGLASGFLPKPTDANPNPVPEEWLFHLREASFGHDADQAMWRTIVPHNITGRPTIEVDKSGLSGLDGSVRVFLNDGSDDYPLIGEFDFDDVEALGESVEQLRGRQLLIVAEPFRGRLGAGNYEIRIAAPITDPRGGWIQDTPGDNRLIPVNATDIVQNQYGDGVATVRSGFFEVLPEFTSGTTETHYYRFWASQPGAFTVRTVAVPGSNVNTTLQVYRLNEADVGGVPLTFMQPLQTDTEMVQPNRDWFPSDRREIDAQIVVNNLSLTRYENNLDEYGTGGGYYYVAVRNEEGSSGSYQLEVDAPDFARLGQFNLTYAEAAGQGTLTYIHHDSGQATIVAPYVSDIDSFVGYYPVQMPDDHNGVLTPSQIGGDGLAFALFLEDGTRIPKQVVSGDFLVPDGPQTLSLRLSENSETNGAVSLSTSVQPHNSLPDLLPAIPTPEPLPTTPRGETVEPFRTAIFPTSGKAFHFTAESGPLAVRVESVLGLVSYDWGVYVRNEQTGSFKLRAIQEFAPGEPDQTTTALHLPDLNGAPVEIVVLVSSSGVIANFEIEVARGLNRLGPSQTSPDDTEALFEPLSTRRLRIDPYTGSASLSGVTGGDWVALSIPDDVTTTTVTVSSISAGAGPEWLFDVFDHSGRLERTVRTTSTSPNLNLFPGRTYHLRVSNQVSFTSFTLSGLASKRPGNGSSLPEPAPLSQDTDFYRVVFNPDGDAIVDLPANEPVMNIPFYVDRPGAARFVFEHPGTASLSVHPLRVVGPSGENDPAILDPERLLDFSDRRAGSSYELRIDLAPGMYLLRAARTDTVAIPEAIRLDLPAYGTKELTYSPATGKTQLEQLEFSAQVSGTGDEGTFRPTFYTATAPGGSLGGMDAIVASVGESFTTLVNTSFEAQGHLAVWQRTMDQSGFSIPATDSFVVGEETLGCNDSACLVTVDSPVAPDGFRTAADERLLVGWSRFGVAGHATISAEFTVPQSDTPNLVIENFRLSPGGEKTIVTGTVRNIGQGAAGTHYNRFLARTAGGIDIGNAADAQFQMSLGPLGTRSFEYEFVPGETSDEAVYVVDIHDQVAETEPEGGDESICVSEDNVACQSLFDAGNRHKPEVTALSLEEEYHHALNGVEVWGRFVSGVFGAVSDIRIQLDDGDGEETILGTGIVEPYTHGTNVVNVNERIVTSGASHIIHDFDFWKLQRPSTGSQTFSFTPIDEWGLRGQTIQRRVAVVDWPTWADDVTFDPEAGQYDLSWRDNVLDFDEPLELPLLGVLDNKVFVGASIGATAGFDPAASVDSVGRGEFEFTVLGQEVYKKSFTTNAEVPAPDGLSFRVSTTINNASLDLEGIDFQIDVDPSIELFDVETPKIPLIAYGIPGLAEISANIQFGLRAILDSRIIIGFTGDEIGLREGSFVGTTITPRASLSGDVRVLGFDLASLSGTMGLDFRLDVGLGEKGQQDGQLVTFDNVPGSLESCLEADLSLGMAAELIGIEVWSMGPFTTNLFTTGDFCSQDLTTLDSLGPAGIPEPMIVGGNDVPVSVSVEPRPNILIDAETGEALFLQVQNTGTEAAPLGSLAFDRRADSASDYSGSLTPIPSASHVSRPVLVETHADSGFSAIAVYQAVATSGTVAGKTRNQLFNDQEIRYRTYSNGVWSAEESLSANSVADEHPAVSFNNSGYGVVAWTQTTQGSPINAEGNLDSSSNDIRAIFYDVETGHWVLESIVSNDVEGQSMSDSQPSVFFADDGRAYVVWLRDDGDPATPDQAKIMFRVLADGVWSPVSELPIDRLPEGSIDQLAISSRGTGRIDILLAVSEPDPRDSNGQLLPGVTDERRTWLFSRSTTQDEIDQPVALETISQGGRYSHLRTLQHPNGGLFAYWHYNNGTNTDVYGTFVDPPSDAQRWSDPFRLTTGEDFEFHPTVAFDQPLGEGLLDAFDDGNALQTAYHQIPVSDDGLQGSPDKPIGSGGTSNVGSSSMPYLPEIAFSTEIALENHVLREDGNPPEAIAGQFVAASATITNRGLRGDQVFIQYEAGPTDSEPGVLHTQVIYLAPGESYEARFNNFPVRPDKNTLSIVAYAMNFDEILDAYSSSSLIVNGFLDVAAHSIDPLSSVDPGETTTLRVALENTSSIDTFDVYVHVYDNDPEHPETPATLIETVHLPSLPGGGEILFVDVAWRVPDSGGIFFPTTIVETKDYEVSELNNKARTFIQILPDAAFEIESRIDAKVLSATGVENVEISGIVYNLGNVDLFDVPVEIWGGTNNAPRELAGTFTIRELPAGELADFSHKVSGLSGLNNYLLLIDPHETLPTQDQDRDNNSAQVSVYVNGLADIGVFPFVFGNTEVVFASVANLGIAATEAFDVEIWAFPLLSVAQFYSTDFGAEELLRTGTIVGTETVEGLPALSDPLLLEIGITDNSLSGSYMFVAIADRIDVVVESLGDDNFGIGLFNFEEIETSLDDLTLSASTLDLHYTLAQDSTPIALRFYESLDDVVDETDVLIGEPIFVTDAESLTAGSHTLNIDTEFLADSIANPSVPYVLVEVVALNGQIDPISSNNTLPVISPSETEFSISDAEVVEGEKGDDARLVFTIARSDNLLANTVHVTTSDGTAKAGGDYTSFDGTVTFQPGGALSQTVSIAVKGENRKEGDETLMVTLTDPENGVLANATGTGTIIDDDKRDPGAHLVGSTLVVIGTNASDTILVTSSAATVTVTFNEGPREFDRGAVSKLYLDGQGKHDTIDVTADIPATLHGRSGHDSLSGGPASDVIFAGKGNDTAHGNGGNDLVTGGKGKDTLSGGSGADTLRGGGSNDSLSGGSGADYLNGGSGRDTVSGQQGDDTLYGSDGHDSLFGGEDDDWLYGERGNDLLKGDAGNDNLFGFTGKDTLHGGEGDDVLQGGSSNDQLHGDSGHDILLGSGGADDLLGGDGNDIAIGGSENDHVRGQAGRDILFGGAGVDTVEGGIGEDIVLAAGRSALPEAALRRILDEWTSERTYATRVANITDGSGSDERLNGDDFLIANQSVTNDATSDDLVGGDAIDWFFADQVRDNLPDFDELEALHELL